MKFVFYDVFLKTLESLEETLILTPVIVVPDRSILFEVMYDTSGVALGEVLGCMNKRLFILFIMREKHLM